MKKYKVWKTFPVNSGTWHTEEKIFDNAVIEITSTGRILVKQDGAVTAIFSKEYSCMEVKNEQQ